MNPPLLKIVHVAPRIASGGGIETLLAWHRQTDAAAGLEAWQLALFDRTADAPEVRSLSLRSGWRDSLRTLRRKFACALAAHPGAMVVYHNGWGLPLFGDVDRAARRFIYLHAGPAYLQPLLPALRGWGDGVVGINRDCLAAARAAWPGFDAARQCRLLAPVAPPTGGKRKRAAASDEFVLGFAGRLERVHKRVDRLPLLVEELARQGLRVHCEVLGDGPWRRRLERICGDRVVFHGWKTGRDYWAALERWDAMVFFSDTEGGPLAMVEGMAAGVIPFFPAIGGSLGDEYAPQLDRRCHYPPGDMAALGRALAAVMAEPAEARAALVARGRALAARHGADDFGREFAAFVRRVDAEPRVSRGAVPRRQPRWADWLPLGFISRFLPGALLR